jgi:transcriptional regulator with XRE-family HTH domain
MADEPALAPAIGRQLARLRTEAGRRQDEVAVIARSFGLGGWSRSVVAALENGRRNLSAEELILLPRVVSILVGRRCSLSDILPPEQPVRVSTVKTVDRTTVLGWLNGRGGEDPDPSGYDPLLANVGALNNVLHGTDIKIEDFWTSEAHVSVKRAADRLRPHLGDIPAIVVAAAAHRLWGHSLDEERDARLGADASGRRGHITRQLDQELREFLGEVL